MFNSQTKDHSQLDSVLWKCILTVESMSPAAVPKWYYTLLSSLTLAVECGDAFWERSSSATLTWL